VLTFKGIIVRIFEKTVLNIQLKKLGKYSKIQKKKERNKENG
jgi:hypothetical protein